MTPARRPTLRSAVLCIAALGLFGVSVTACTSDLAGAPFQVALAGTGGGGGASAASTTASSASSTLDSTSTSGASSTASSSSGGCVPKPETCNGLDDDCNGLVDDVAHVETITTSGVTINQLSFFGGPNYVTVKPGAMLAITFDYDIVDTCQGCTCRDQILVGFAPDPPLDCPYDGTPGCNGIFGSISTNFAAPLTPGPHPLHIDRSQQYGCMSAWSSPNFPTEGDIGMVCVVP